MYHQFLPVGQTLNQEFYLTLFMVSTKSSIKETTRTLAGTQLVSSSQQCSHAYGALHPEEQ
jgi:hypothetical protein